MKTYDNFLKILFKLFILIAFGCSCSQTQYQPLVESVESLPQRTINTVKTSLQRENLQALLQDNPQWRQPMLDIVLGLEAEVFEENGDWESAANTWLDVLRSDLTLSGDRALKGWLRSYERVLQTEVSAEFLAKKLLSLTQNGSLSPWLVRNKLDSPNKLTLRIQRKRIIVKSHDEFRNLVLPSQRTDDPFWLESSAKMCGKKMSIELVSWRALLSVGRRAYWDGLQAMCLKNYLAAADHFLVAIEQLQGDQKSRALLVQSLDLMVQVQKRLGRREAAAAAYLNQSKVLAKLTKEDRVGDWTYFDLLKKQVEIHLWVARTQAIQGAYIRAKEGIEASLKILSNLPDNLNPSQRDAFVELKAEAYHTYASRISYEEGDFVAALGFNKIAQAIPGLNREWRDRLAWAAGWYSYKNSDLFEAIRSWEAIESNSKSDPQKSKVLYWIGRSYMETGQYERAKIAFAQLSKEFPLSFYRIVGIPTIQPEKRWSNDWPGLAQMQKDFGQFESFDAPSYKSDLDASLKLLRLEICLLAGLQSWQEQVSSDLFHYISSQPKLFRDIEATVYVSKLLYHAGDYQRSMLLTTQLASKDNELWERFPSQLLTYFPMPYFDEYSKAAVKNGISHDLSFAISRQESSFDSSATSPAEAYGLMQLVLPTAIEQSKRSEIVWRKSSEELKLPSLNISLGTAYLAGLGRRYRGNWYQAFAAYNAGEYIVDAWLARRYATDPVAWVEGLSFSETSGYVKSVWRNWEVYRFLLLEGKVVGSNGRDRAISGS